MTKAQLRKLDVILAKLENLQREVKSISIRGRLNAAKSELLRAIPPFVTADNRGR